MKFFEKTGENVVDIPKDVVARSIDFEITRELAARLSERRAWIVATCSILLATILAVGYFFVMPLKEKIPYMVVVDPYAGNSVVAKLSDNFDNMTITSNEAINKANISNFITAYESYDWDLWSRRDGLIVYAMAQGDVLKAYSDLYSSKTLSPDIIYGRKRTRRVRIKSLVLTGKDQNGVPSGATVRFERLIIDKGFDTPMSAETLIATLEFEYKSNLTMQEEMRIQNPLGFRVKAYRVDPDSSSSQSRDLVIRELSSTALGQPLVAPSEPQQQTKK